MAGFSSCGSIILGVPFATISLLKNRIGKEKSTLLETNTLKKSFLPLIKCEALGK